MFADSLRGRGMYSGRGMRSGRGMPEARRMPSVRRGVVAGSANLRA